MAMMSTKMNDVLVINTGGARSHFKCWGEYSNVLQATETAKINDGVNNQIALSDSKKFILIENVFIYHMHLLLFAHAREG